MLQRRECLPRPVDGQHLVCLVLIVDTVGNEGGMVLLVDELAGTEHVVAELDVWLVVLGDVDLATEVLEKYRGALLGPYFRVLCALCISHWINSLYA